MLRYAECWNPSGTRPRWTAFSFMAMLEQPWEVQTLHDLVTIVTSSCSCPPLSRKLSIFFIFHSHLASFEYFWMISRTELTIMLCRPRFGLEIMWEINMTDWHTHYAWLSICLQLCFSLYVWTCLDCFHNILLHWSSCSVPIWNPHCRGRGAVDGGVLCLLVGALRRTSRDFWTVPTSAAVPIIDCNNHYRFSLINY